MLEHNIQTPLDSQTSSYLIKKKKKTPLLTLALRGIQTHGFHE